MDGPMGICSECVASEDAGFDRCRPCRRQLTPIRTTAPLETCDWCLPTARAGRERCDFCGRRADPALVEAPFWENV